MTQRVLHLAGSAVSDLYADLSRLYAADCLDATADPERYEFQVAYVTPDGCWRFPADFSTAAIDSAEPLSAPAAIERIARLRPDIALPQMFCLPGMTSYRGLFDVLGIPYLGNTADVMALGADKPKARAVVAAAGVKVPRGQVLRRGECPTLSPPFVVKPVDADNSLGISLVRTDADRDAALAGAFAHSDAVLVEDYVPPGREVRCGIIVRDSELVCLPLEEYPIDPVHKPIRSYQDKIRRGSDGALGLVAKDLTRAWIVGVEDPITQRVWEAARRCHLALGCRHYSLFDFRIDPSGRPWFLEAGLYCSFACKSVISTMAAAADIPLGTLFRGAIGQALSA